MSTSPASESERQQWLTILELASEQSPNQIDQHWNWLLEELNLGPDYFLFIVEAIKQGRWRSAKNPRAYIKTVARREALRSSLEEERRNPLVLLDSKAGESFAMEKELDERSYEWATSDVIRGAGGAWRKGGGGERTWEDDDDGYAVNGYWGRLLSNVPGSLLLVEEPTDELKSLLEEINRSTDEFHIHAPVFIRPDWDAWATAAGFSEWERKVLFCRLQGVSRDRALSEQTEPKAVKALQAAWRKFDRTGFARLQAAAKNIQQKMSRK